jgi:energy-coupling factor transporter ATP-binding protein EcfA2
MTDLLPLTRQAQRQLRYDIPLDPETDQDLLVDLHAARGSFNEATLLWTLGVTQNLDDPLVDIPKQCILFGGHRGCGKSTELKQLAHKLHRPNLYYVVFVDALSEVDINNIRYSDILLIQAKVLIEKLTEDKITIEKVFLEKLEQWFRQRIKTRLNIHEMSSQGMTGAKAEVGLPFLAHLFASLTNAISIGSTYTEEIREIVQNSFSEFAEAFNTLIQQAEEKLKRANKGQKLLFIVDGTDRLNSKDADDFFVRDVHQLKQIQTHCIYCAPIDILSENGRIPQDFKVVRLPMIKIAEKGSDHYNFDAVKTLKALIYKRVDARLFANEAVLEKLVHYSGGHLRDLMRLVDYCLTETLGSKKIDALVAEAATGLLAVEYRRIILQEDYALLNDIDQQGKEYTPGSKSSRRLLYDLVLLEYNAYWWQTHPVVRTLSAYQNAESA